MIDQARLVDLLEPVGRALDLASLSAPAYLRCEIAARRQDLERALQLLAEPPRVVFRPLGSRGDRWQIGVEGEERPYSFAGVGLAAAYLCLTRGQVACADLSPRSANPDVVIRQAVRSTAADWVESHTGCLPLANTLRGMQVAGGFVQYPRRRSGPVFVLSLSLSTSAEPGDKMSALNGLGPPT